ncbi:MAG: hypothetical protein IJV82_02620 [Oscillospiraceae bacterium]|nr:hypothetical protein [Oscillospiraceae bacterium]
MSQKACIIVVWFGKLPEYFGFWERSCQMNEAYADFLLVTDQDYTSPSSNIHVQKTTMGDLKRKMSEKLGLSVSFEKAFKSCDLRPAYGVIFSEELAGYQYWGHCDLDQVFGDMGILMDRADLENYDKIGRSGHLTLFRNDPATNDLFRQEGALFDYQTVFTTPENYAFDERTGICRIAQKQKTPYLNIVDMRADIRVRTRRLEINGAKNYEKQLFYWENGHLFRAYMENGAIQEEPFIYIHFQKKKLKNLCGAIPGAFFIGREGFFEKSGPVTAADFDRYNPADSRLSNCADALRYYGNKMKDYLRITKGQRKVWVAQKRISNEVYE